MKKTPEKVDNKHMPIYRAARAIADMARECGRQVVGVDLRPSSPTVKIKLDGGLVITVDKSTNVAKVKKQYGLVPVATPH